MIMDLSPDELLTTTRSVRRRLDLSRPVPLELVHECLEVALQAPSGSNRQGWRWIVVTDAGLRGEIGALYRRAVQRYLDSEEPPIASSPTTPTAQRSNNGWVKASPTSAIAWQTCLSCSSRA